MKIIIQYTKQIGPIWSHLRSHLQILVFGFLLLAGTLNAQEYLYEKPNWYLGLAGGVNLNYYRGSTQMLNDAFTPPVTFHNGQGLGAFVAPLVEYQNHNTGLGFMLQAGYDSRSSKFDQVISDCNCPADLTSRLSYITVEPSLRFAPGAMNFYFFGGPRFAFNLQKSFTYKLGINPAYPDQEPTPDVTGDFSNVKKTLLSMQIGAGFDIPLNSQNNRTQAVLSPFVSIQPYFGQSPRTVETWNITTVRVGTSLKFGFGKKIQNLLPIETPFLPEDVSFSINSPENIALERTVSETFPLRNYIFFNLGSTEIPDRYVLIDKDQAKSFREDQPEVFNPKNLSGRSAREMSVYYNVLNILGERLVKNPDASITLVGSSEKGPQDGLKMAESVRNYLTDIFGVKESRILVEGNEKPKLPSEQPGGTLELDLLREGDRRVSIESTSPSMLMVFENGKGKYLKPVEIKSIQNAPLDSYVSFQVDGASETLSSWTLDMKDKNGYNQHYGPYSQETVWISGRSILGNKPEGHYNVTMTAKRKDGTTFTKKAETDIVLWKQAGKEEGKRFSILYEFNDANTLDLYETYLNNVVVPKITPGSKLIIHGYTDIIGSEISNKALSMARARDVEKIIKASLGKSGRTDVRFDVYGFGEDKDMSPFNNELPEERFYNRTVIIDVIPKR